MEKNHTPPLNYDPSDPDKMRLPASTTCGDCVQKCLPNGIRYMLPPLVLSGYQLREALTFIAPDGTDDQMEQEVCIAERDAGIDMDGEKYESGLCCWMEEYPEEGSIALTGNSALYTPPAAEAQGVPSVDEIAQFIRAADGAHQMGAGALAERLHAWLAPQPANPASAPVSKRADQWARLYTTANALVARIGEKGEIDSRANETESLMDALHDLDGGQWVPGLTPAIAQVSGSTAQPKGIVTEFNVGRYVMNEDDCRAEGLDFRAYERGVADAAAAFARNMGTAQGAEPPPNLSEYDLGQWWVKEIERRRAEKEAAPTQYGWLSMESVASHIAEQVVSKIAALTPQEQAEPPLVDWKDAVLDALAAWPPMDFPVTTPPREILAAVIKMERDAATYFAREQAEPALPDEVIQLLNHIEDVVDDENWNRIDVAKWNAVTALARKADSKGGAND